MIGVLESMARTMKHALSGETFTVAYPEEEPEVSPRFRGVHRFSRERCIWCRQCESVCPNNTIQIVTGEGRTGEQYTLQIGQCLYCRLCEEVCPVEAIVLTRNFEVVADTRAELAYDEEELGAVSWYDEDIDPLAAREPDREARDGDVDYR